MDRIIRHENNGKRRITAILLVFLVALTCTVRAESTGREKDHPCIRITTEEGQPILSRTEYVPAEIRVFNCDAEDELTAEGGIRVRTDLRARAVCPLAKQGLSAMDPDFREAVRAAGEALSASPRQAEMMEKLRMEQEELRSIQRAWRR